MKSLHIISQYSGSLEEITNNLTPYFRNKFKVTEELRYDEPEVPESLDILLMHYLSPVYINNRVFDAFKLKILIQPIDGTEIKEEFVELIKKFDIIICPSKENKSILERHKISSKKIKVIPNFITKEDIWDSEDLNNKFTFYSELFYNSRKNAEDMVECFLKAHNDSKIEFILKINEIDKSKLKNLKTIIKNNKSKSKVRIINDYLSKKELKKIWRNVDCYVNFSGIEGFSIPLLRFRVNGVPIITLNNPDSGYHDFISKELLIRDLEYVKKTDNEIYTENSVFAIPNKQEAIKKLQIALTKKIDPKLNLKILNQYSLEVIQEKYTNLFLNEYKKVSSTEIDLNKNIHDLNIDYYSPYGTNGYAIAGKEYIKGLNKVSNIKWVPFYFDSKYTVNESKELLSLINNNIKSEVKILHSTPEWWPDLIEDDKLNIGYTVWETDKIHPSWVDYIHSVDILFVPSEWNKKVFQNCGIKIPIYVIPHIAPDINIKNTSSEEIYSFYTIGQWTERKGSEDTIRVYLDTFNSKDKVELTIKTFGNNYSDIEKKIIINKVNSIVSEYSDPAKINLITEELSSAQILNLHQRNDCYISACKSEGWGLGAFEAALHKNPVIMTGFGGQTEFLNINKELLIDYKLIKVKGMEHIPWYKKDQKWAEPDLNHFSKLMNKVYKNNISDLDYQIEFLFNSNKISNQIIKIIKQHNENK